MLMRAAGQSFGFVIFCLAENRFINGILYFLIVLFNCGKIKYLLFILFFSEHFTGLIEPSLCSHSDTLFDKRLLINLHQNLLDFFLNLLTIIFFDAIHYHIFTSLDCACNLHDYCLDLLWCKSSVAAHHISRRIRLQFISVATVVFTAESCSSCFSTFNKMILEVNNFGLVDKLLVDQLLNIIISTL